jgi:mannose-1-phosphate guanylyltransferase
MIVPVVLSGGSGTRLWPLSRQLFPKQFFSLINKTTLFQDTILRLPENISNPLIICNEEHRFIVAEQLRQINSENNGIILEPFGKNTAPAIALAAIRLLDEKADPTLLILSSDHHISNNKGFHRSVLEASKIAKKNKMVAFGVRPSSPETGFGYIQTMNSKSNFYQKIISFTEKPNLENAKKYLKSHNYFWNSGIFMFKASTYLNELEKFAPDILDICKKSYSKTYKDLDFIRIANDEFSKCPSQSIDYAVMEKTDNGIMVPLDSSWSDIGSWGALWESQPKDEQNNSTEGDITLNNVKNSLIYGSNRLITVNDISNLVIIDTPDALLVSSKKNSQDIKKIVEKLRCEKRLELDSHRKTFRPWGYFDLIEKGEGFQVKRIFVNKGAKLSLQKHEHRAEHWVVVKGIAEVTCSGKTFKLKQNQSTFIPRGEVHRLVNCEDFTLEIIEIQTGKYLEEDDIIRIEDDYKRG